MGNIWNEEVESSPTNNPIKEEKIDPEDFKSDDWSLISKLSNYNILDSCSCSVIVRREKKNFF